MKNLKCSGGQWLIRKTVDDSGDYEVPTYDILAVYEYGPEGIGTANSNPYNARLFSCSKELVLALLDKVACNCCMSIGVSCEGCRENNNKLLIEKATGQKIEELLNGAI
jgi:hypothetical protein